MKKNNDLDFDYRFGFSVPEVAQFKAKKGLDESVIKTMSKIKNEPDWMLQLRLKAYRVFQEKPMPSWGADLSKIDFSDIYYYLKPTDEPKSSWEDLPKEIKETYDRIGVPEAEKKFLAGVSAQFESEVVYESIQKELKRQGVIFSDMDTGLKKYPEIVKQYFASLVPIYDNKFAALNSAVWSGGSFVYVPKGVKVTLPLQAYFRINAQNFGQFERTLIIAEEGSFVHYIEGCLLAGERVLTEEGWKNIETIKPGEVIFNHQGNYDKVKAIMTREYNDELYCLIPLSSENKVFLTKEHPVLAVKREKVLVKRKPRKNWLPEVDSQKLKTIQPEFIPVSQLRKGDFIFFPKIKIIEEKPLDKYLIEFLGYYLAEGSAFYHQKLKQYVVSLSFSLKEKEIADRCSFLTKKIIGKKGSINLIKEKNEVRFLVYSKELYDLVILYCGKYSFEKKLHKTILNQPKNLLSLFFWSYFKGDGNLTIKKKSGSHLYRISTASKQLAEQIQLILNRLGIFASLRLRKGGKDKIKDRLIKRKDQYIISFSQPKKWSEIRETKDYFIVPIKKIEKKSYQGVVFNLEIEGKNSYLAKGIALHNCTAPIYTTSSLHAAVVEIFVKKNARVRYTTVQNWSKNVFNLVTKRSLVEENGVMEWIDCNLGSQVTMKYPACILKGEGARGEVLSIAYASANQVQDAGAKMIHLAPNTSSRIISKSISSRGGRTSYRGLVQVNRQAKNSSVYVSCDALLLDEKSRSDTYPTMRIENSQVDVQHEATVEKIGEEKLFYLQSRGIKKSEAEGLLVNGFIEPVVKEIPLEYSIELNRLINLEMEGSVG